MNYKDVLENWKADFDYMMEGTEEGTIFQSSSGFIERVDKLSLTICETTVLTSETPKLTC